MIDLKKLREDPEFFRRATAAKNRQSDLVNQVLLLDEKKRELLRRVENLRAERRKLGKENIERGREIKNELTWLEADLEKVEEELMTLLPQIPNPALPSVPIGKGEEENVEIRKWGEPRKFDFEPKDHLQLGKDLGILDFEAGAKVAGSQFYYWYGDGAKLQMALIWYSLDLLEKEGFLPVITPDLARSRYYLGTGYLPLGEEEQTYTINGEDLGLIATAEVTLAGLHADEILEEKQLPLKYIGYSHCFRKEGGAYGRYSKGLYRVHQFMKTEMFVYCRPEESNEIHEQLLALEEKIYQGLELPYRVVEMCTGDLGAMAARKFDIEAWMPARGTYGEVTSTSNTTDYQSRNLNVKYRKKDGTLEYVHLLNGTAITSTRAPLAILENFQEKDGSVRVPRVLQPYLGKEVISPKS